MNTLKELQAKKLANFQQQVWISWLIYGDQSTSFFAKAIKSCQVKNSVMHTIDENGNQTNKLGDMKECAIQYFQQLFSFSTRLELMLNLILNFTDAISQENECMTQMLSTN